MISFHNIEFGTDYRGWRVEKKRLNVSCIKDQESGIKKNKDAKEFSMEKWKDIIILISNTIVSIDILIDNT